jgi:hypothetical protein
MVPGPIEWPSVFMSIVKNICYRLVHSLVKLIWGIKPVTNTSKAVFSYCVNNILQPGEPKPVQPKPESPKAVVFRDKREAMEALKDLLKVSSLRHFRTTVSFLDNKKFQIFQKSLFDVLKQILCLHRDDSGIFLFYLHRFNVNLSHFAFI